MLKRKFVPLIAAVVMFFLSASSSVFAQTDPFAGCNPANSDSPQINTALGCVPVKIGDFVTWLLPILFGIVGGISFILMIYGFILVASSGGDPKKAEGGKETITSAITGLLVSLFALFILRLIAVDILHIPGIN